LTQIKSLARRAVASACLMRARLRAPRLEEPPILVIGYPRSGTTWVAEVLSAARGVLYLHEPFTQAHHLTGTEPTIMRVQGAYALGCMQTFEDMHYERWWRLPARTTRRPWRWLRGEGRLLIKEVNPFLVQPLIDRLSPRIVFVLRHPAAIYASMKSLGWTDLPEFRDGDGTLARQHGRRQASVLGAAWSAAQSAGRGCITIRHDLFCAAPAQEFKNLCGQLNLPFDGPVRNAVIRTTSGDNARERGPWSIVRDTKRVASRWRRIVGAREEEDLLEGWMDTGQHDLLRMAVGASVRRLRREVAR